MQRAVGVPVAITVEPGAGRQPEPPCTDQTPYSIDQAASRCTCGVGMPAPQDMRAGAALAAPSARGGAESPAVANRGPVELTIRKSAPYGPPHPWRPAGNGPGHRDRAAPRASGRAGARRLAHHAWRDAAHGTTDEPPGRQQQPLQKQQCTGKLGEADR